MTSHHKQQKKSEYNICNSFLDLYNNLHVTKVKFTRHGNASKNEPDCICTDDIFIEITSVQDNSYQAEKLHSNHSVKQQTNFQLNSLANLEQIIFQKLNKLNSGNYNGLTDGIILVCNLESPLVLDEDVDSFIENYTPYSQDGPFNKFFSEAWLYWRSEKCGSIKIKKINV